MNKSIYSSKDWLNFVRKADEELIKLSRVDIFKATGKGGQKKNKTSNAIRLTLSYISVTESSSRSKAENTKKAVKKLRTSIALDTTKSEHNRVFKEFPEEIIPYINSSTVRINPTNPVFPIFVGCLVDVFIKSGGRWDIIGKEFGTTTSQIRKFVEKNRFLPGVFKELKQQMDNEVKIQTKSVN